MLSSGFYLLAFILQLVTAQSKCYYPDGTDTFKDDPQWPYAACNNATKFSACCNFAEGDSCVAGGLCYFPGTPDAPRDYIYRGACTDQSWTDGSCATYCKKSPSHYESLIFCPNTTQFCCQKSIQGGECCDQADIRFTLDISPNIMQQIIQGNNGTALPTGGQRPTSSSSAGSTASTSTSASTAVTHQSSGLSPGAKAGISVAAVAAVVLFGLGWFLGRRKKNKKGTSNVGQFVRRLSKQSSKEVVDSAHGRNAKSDLTVEDGQKPGLEVVESLVSPIGTSEEPTTRDEAQERRVLAELAERGDPVQLPA